MAKKVVSKKVSKKKVVSKKIPSKKVSLKQVPLKKVFSNKSNVKSFNSKKFVDNSKSLKQGSRVSWNSLVFFGILFLISLVSYSAVTHAIYQELFFLLSLAFGAISVALVLVILISFFYSKIKVSK